MIHFPKYFYLSLPKPIVRVSLNQMSIYMIVMIFWSVSFLNELHVIDLLQEMLNLKYLNLENSLMIRETKKYI